MVSEKFMKILEGTIDKMDEKTLDLYLAFVSPDEKRKLLKRILRENPDIINKIAESVDITDEFLDELKKASKK